MGSIKYGAFVAFGIVAIVAVNFIVFGSLAVMAEEGDKYYGLTDKQTENVKMIRQMCDNKADLVSTYNGQIAGDRVMQRCEEMEAKTIATYKASVN